MFNKYNKADSIVKSNVRKIIFDEFAKYRHAKTPQTILTLPNTNFELETNLKNKFNNSKIICYEYNKTTYNQSNKVKPTFINLYNKDIYTSNRSTKHDMIYLDLCNAYTPETINKVITFIKTTNFNKKALFAVTFTVARGVKNNKLFADTYTNYKTKGVIKHLGNFLPEVKSVKTVEYSCKDISTKSNKMICIIFKLK